MIEACWSPPIVPHVEQSAQPAGSTVQQIAVHPDLQVVESNRHHGNVDPRFGNPVDVLRARIKLAGQLGCERLVCVVPYGSDEFIDLDQGPITTEPDGYRIWPDGLQMASYRYDPDAPPYMADLPGDGLITTKKNVGLSLNPADCAPLVLYDPKVQALALVHVGRRGAEKDIAPKVVDYMTEYYGVNPLNLVAYFGPSISPDSYVLPERRGALTESAWESFLPKTSGGYKVDVVGYARQRLVESGVDPTNIAKSPIDVASHPDYFSLVEHKQSKADDTRPTVPDGRNGFMVMIKPETTPNVA